MFWISPGQEEVLDKMALNLLDIISESLLSTVPSPEFWGIILVIVFSGYMIMRKFPMSASGHISIILIIALVSMVGGVFELIRSIMWAISGGVFFLGLWKFIGQR